MPTAERQARLSRLKTSELDALRYAWRFWARPEQLLPPGDWLYWLILAGRGTGKTRTGAEAVREWVRDFRFVNLIGPTADDARDVMIEGESGLLAVCPPAERPRYVKHERKLIWPNGAQSMIFTAEEPDRLRGKQHEKLWCDELAAWRYQEQAWDQAMLGLRLGRKPQAIITTTPRPTKVVKALAKDPHTHLTRGTTYDNKDNLAQAFYERIIAKYEGTRLGRQELMAEILEDIPGALWKIAQLDAARIEQAPVMQRVAVAVDPAVTANPDSDETGIIGGGVDGQGRGYVLGDASGVYTPSQWAQKVIAMYDTLSADCVMVEVNNGGDLVAANLRAHGFSGRIAEVRASRGKMTRAEPVSALYEQGKIHHVGVFSGLESQMTTWDATSEESPDRVDALVWLFTGLMLGNLSGVEVGANPFF